MRSNLAGLFLSIGPLICQAASALYHPVREYAGSTFFDRWTYYGNYDNTTQGECCFFFYYSGFLNDTRRTGNVTYVDQATAVADQLTYVNSAGNAIIKVDNTTTIVAAPLIYRNSVSR